MFKHRVYIIIIAFASLCLSKNSGISQTTEGPYSESGFNANEEIFLLSTFKEALHNQEYQEAANSLVQIFRFHIYKSENYFEAVKTSLEGIKFCKEYSLHETHLDLLTLMIECQIRLPKDLFTAQEYLYLYFAELLENDPPLLKEIGNYYNQRIIGRLRMTNKIDSDKLKRALISSQHCLNYFSDKESSQLGFYIATRQDVALYYTKEYGMIETIMMLDQIEPFFATDSPNSYWHQMQKASALTEFNLMDRAIDILLNINIEDLKESASKVFYYKVLHKAYKGKKDYKNAWEALENKMKYEDILSELSYSNLLSVIVNENTILSVKEGNKVLLERYKYSIIIACLLLIVLTLLSIFYRRNRKQQKEIRKQHDHLEELNATKDRLVSIMAHDMRTPILSLNKISSKVKYLVERKGWDTIKDMGNQLEFDIVNLSNMLDKLIAWALSKSKNQEKPKEVVNLQELVISMITDGIAKPSVV